MKASEFYNQSRYMKNKIYYFTAYKRSPERLHAEINIEPIPIEVCNGGRFIINGKITSMLPTIYGYVFESESEAINFYKEEKRLELLKYKHFLETMLTNVNKELTQKEMKKSANKNNDFKSVLLRKCGGNK